VFLAHLAVTDVAGGRFTWAERVSRTGPGLAGAEEASLGVRLLSWSAREEGGRFVLDAADGPLSLHLVLTPGASPPVLHGPGGLSRKGDKPGQASWYYSLPDLAAEGRLGVPWVGEPIPVRGQVWFDHEFGSNQMAPDQTGWDWFGLRLDDGRKLMLYLIRRSDGTVEPASGGTLVEADGRTRPLGSGDFLVRVLDRWLSPRSGGRYPSRWRITLAGEGLELEVRPALTDQELSTDHSTGVTYWEGVVEARGSRRGAPVRGEGYAELTGYAGRLGGLF
jgi:predicted secreted hydrolase